MHLDDLLRGLAARRGSDLYFTADSPQLYRVDGATVPASGDVPEPEVIERLIREDKTAQILSVIQTGAQHGMQSLDQSLRDLVMQGKLSRHEAMKKSSNPRLFDAAGTTGAEGSAVSAVRPGAVAR